MSIALIDLSFAVAVAFMGAVGGWYLHGRRRGVSEHEEIRYAREVLGRLRELAAHVAAGVGEHTSRVEEINEELHSVGLDEPEAVVSAVDKLIHANSTMQEQLASADERLREQAQQIECHAAEARTDALTGLANRRAFDDEMDHRLAEFQRHARTFSLIMLDVDHFKKFNDTYGHQAGDEVLRGLGKVLRETVREMDIPARYGGEEFSLILPGTPVPVAAEAADRVRTAIAAARFRVGKSELKVTASLGVAELVDDETADAMIERADTALYASKQAGRNCTHYHDGTQIRPFAIAEIPEQPQEEPEQPVAGEAAAEPSPAPTREPQSPGPTDPSRQTVSTEPKMYDRDAFSTLLGQRMAEWRRGGARPSVLLVRINDFSEVGAEHGQRASAMVLRATSQFLRAAIREMDLLAHYDVGTFAVLLPGSELANTMGVAERLREAIARCTLPLPSGRLRFSVSVGASQAEAEEDVPRMMRRTAQALDAAVQSGGNCCYFHNGQWSETAEAVMANAQ